MLDWIFEGMVTWFASIITKVLDAVSALFLNALGTNMTVMEEYFPFVAKAYDIMQYTAWALLFLITVWQLFRVFGGPVTEAENPWTLLARSCLFAVLIAYAKPIFLMALDIARAPYTALMEVEMTMEDFTFAGIEQTLISGLVTTLSVATVVGAIVIAILMLAVGWNYFKLLLETVERYIVVGVLCYTSPLAYCMGASKATSQVFKSWCRMVGSQLLLLVMNVWFIRGFNSCAGRFAGGGPALTSGYGNVFLWIFCATAFLKTAQKFDSYLASIGLNVAQTGGGIGLELIMAARMITMAGGSGMRSAGKVFGGGASVVGNAGGGFASGFANMFKSNSYVRDAVVDGGTRMGLGGGAGFVGRAFGGIAARNGAQLSADSIASVASRTPNMSGSIAGDIADRSLANFMPQLSGYQLSGTQISGGRISTMAMGSDGKISDVNMYSASQFGKPDGLHSEVMASDGSMWYQMAGGEGFKSFFSIPEFHGTASEAELVAETFPSASEGTTLRTVGEGALEASTDEGNAMWYSSAYYLEPDAPHGIMQSSDGVDWYAMQPSAAIPDFESGIDAESYNRAQFENFMPGYEQRITTIETGINEGQFEVGNEDGSGTKFYDASQYQAPRGEYSVMEDANNREWYAVSGEAAVERKPVYENGKPVYEGDNVVTVSVDTVRYKTAASRYDNPEPRNSVNTNEPRRRG